MCFSREKKEMKRIEALANEIDALSPKFEAYTDEQLKACTAQFKERLSQGETTDDILKEAFAVVREAANRTLGMRHFKVQLMGGIILYQGRIAEMKTGEGKTLVATLPAYLKALTGKGVHIVTVNEYLAQRDSLWMGKIYEFLDLTVGVILNSQNEDEKREIYKKDIVYSTASNFGFDYLRDNLCVSASNIMQRELNFALIDEVDSILIDEARTPLIISGPSGKPANQYKKANDFVKTLEYVESDQGDDEKEKLGDVELDEKDRTVSLTDSGVAKAEDFYGFERGHLSDVENMDIFDYINTALKARFLMRINREYIKKDGQIFIVDSNTGRVMAGRRFSKGLHQAIEAKEGCAIRDENRTVATITIQNFFRLYSGLAGMTGTAKTEAEELSQIYGLDVLVVPTNKPIMRRDDNDKVYSSEGAKYDAIVADVKDCQKRGQPVLVGVPSVAKSELLDKIFSKAGIPHVVLNAKNNTDEAGIVAQAGRFGAVTIATNMAGRGTDILLGGNPEYYAKANLRKFYKYTEAEVSEANTVYDTDDAKIKEIREKYNALYVEEKKKTDIEKQKVIEQGGLKIIGTERNDSRRVDNQLRGRAGRQGDIGSSVFYVSLEDEMIRHFGGDRLQFITNMVDDALLSENRLITKTIERSQKILESRQFAARKNVLNYDDVTNEQRKVIYAERKRILDGEDMHEEIKKMIEPIAKKIINDNLIMLYRGRNEEEKDEAYKDFVNASLKSIIYPELERIEDVDEDDPDYRPGIKRAVYKFPFSKNEVLETKPADLLVKLEEKGQSNLDFRRDEFNDYKDTVLSKNQALKDIDISYKDVERTFLLKSLDKYWIEHLDGVDELKEGIGLRAVAQQDPLMAFKRESRELFDETMQKIRDEVVKLIIQTSAKDKMMYYSNFIEEFRQDAELRKSFFREMLPRSVQAKAKPQTVVNTTPKVGRNDPCPCGSGKKYKNCCGK